MTTTDDEVLVNVATWDGPPLESLGGLTVWNAPRPLYSEGQDPALMWQGGFRAGVFYAAGADELNRTQAARPLRFVTNAWVEALVALKLAEYGYESAEDAGMTVAEVAESYGLPYVDEA